MKDWLSIWLLLFVACTSMAVLSGCGSDLDIDQGEDDLEIEVDPD